MNENYWPQCILIGVGTAADWLFWFVGLFLQPRYIVGMTVSVSQSWPFALLIALAVGVVATFGTYLLLLVTTEVGSVFR